MKVSRNERAYHGVWFLIVAIALFGAACLLSMDNGEQPAKAQDAPLCFTHDVVDGVHYVTYGDVVWQLEADVDIEAVRYTLQQLNVHCTSEMDTFESSGYPFTTFTPVGIDETPPFLKWTPVLDASEYPPGVTVYPTFTAAPPATDGPPPDAATETARWSK